MAIRVDTPVQFLKGVGPRLGDVLRKRGVSTVGELLHWYPRAYEDRRVARSISSLVPDEIVSLKATVLGVRSYNLGRSRRKIYDVVVRDDSGTIHCKYFRTPYRGYFERFQPGQLVRVVGKVLNYRGSIEFHHPDIKDVEGDEDESDSLIPLYTETDGISPTKLRKIMGLAVENLIDSPEAPRPDYARKSRYEVPLEKVEVIDKLPGWIHEKYGLLPLEEALKNLHIPPGDAGPEYTEQKSPAHKRVIFEEFFWLELFLATRKTGWTKEKGVKIEGDEGVLQTIRQSLDFDLTGGQLKALEEILMDLRKDSPMHRMVQGDVGCGKTLVALLAASYAVSVGFQVALMAPTEILAEQHFKNALKIFTELGVECVLLTGSQKAKEKREVLDRVASGAAKVIVGTHALIQDSVEFHQLGLAIVDEQHRFGVEQRSRLKQKGRSPHVLLMTATPIPRTLAMTVYGDLDVSVIREMPVGRQAIITRVAYESKRAKMLQFLRDQIAKGRQAYIVYPLVEESEKIELKDAISNYQALQTAMPDLKFGLLHGKMKPDEKDQVMRRFRDHEYHCLVATTVIEVGVDVPNANLMVIEHSERFGLSQLHQLRGRVGRGEHKSYCVLMLGHAVSEESRERVQIMEKTSDGFKISEEDLAIRGPGEFMGTRQSGLPGFKMANLVRDVEILQRARDAAFEVLRRDPRLAAAENHLLREELLRAHGPAALASVG